MKILLVLLALVSLVAGDGLASQGKVEGRRSLQKKGEVTGARSLKRGKGKGSKRKLDCSFRSPPIKVEDEGTVFAKVYAIINQDKKIAKYRIISQGGNWLAFGRSDSGGMDGAQPVIAYDGGAGMVVDMFYAYEYGVTRFTDQTGLERARVREKPNGNMVLDYVIKLKPPASTNGEPNKLRTSKYRSNLYCVARGDGSTLDYHAYREIVNITSIDECIVVSD